MLVTSIFSFFHNDFHPSEGKSQFSLAFILSSAKCFKFDRVKNFVGSERDKIRVAQITENVNRRLQNNVEKGQNTGLNAFSTLLTIFF